MLEQTDSIAQSRAQARDSFGLPLSQLSETAVICLTPENSVIDAAKLMFENHIGDVVIVEEKNGLRRPIGMITDRDIVIHSTAKKRDPESIRLSEIMSKKVISIREGEDLSRIIQLFTSKGVSRLPIVDSAGALKGILTSKRVFQFLVQGLSEMTLISEKQQRREQRTH